MASTKNILPPYQAITDGAMVGDLTSTVTNIQGLDNIAIQLTWTGTAVGTFSVQGSVDYYKPGQTVLRAGTWTPITLTPAPVAAGASSDILLNLDGLGFPYIRVVYTHSSSTGTLQCWISGRSV